MVIKPTNEDGSNKSSRMEILYDDKAYLLSLLNIEKEFRISFLVILHRAVALIKAYRKADPDDVTLEKMTQAWATENAMQNAKHEGN